MNISSILKQNGRVSFGNIVTISRNVCGSRVYRNKYAELPDKLEWSSTVKEAEKIVGYPTSFLKLQWLLNDEVVNVGYLKKLVGMQHPFSKLSKSFFFKNELASWGLVVLLIAKAGGVSPSTIERDRDPTAGILHSQRVVAEVTDLIRSSMIIHRGMIKVEEKADNAQNMNYGNKIALLTGDYLLSRSFHDLAHIRNYTVKEIISSALRDCSEAEFFGRRDNENEPLPEIPTKTTDTNILEEKDIDLEPVKVSEALGNPREEWIIRNVLSVGNLLGKSCQATLLLADRDTDLQREGYFFGKHWALAWQAKLEYESFSVRSRKLSLVSAPIMMHLTRDPGLYEEIKKGCYNVDDCDYDEIRRIVLAGSALDDAKDLQHELADKALKNLDRFPDSTSKGALQNMIKAM